MGLLQTHHCGEELLHGDGFGGEGVDASDHKPLHVFR
jgi:hypothetical protein